MEIRKTLEHFTKKVSMWKNGKFDEIEWNHVEFDEIQSKCVGEKHMHMKHPIEKIKVSCHSCFSSESKTTRSLKFIFWWCFFPAFHVQFHWNAIHDFVPGTRHFLLFHMAITCDHLLLDVKPAMERAYRWNDAYGEWYIIGIIAQCKKR